MKQLEHPSRDTSNRCAVDALLREYGFVIHSRPKNKPPVWSYCGDIYSQEEALTYLDPDDIWHAEYIESAIDMESDQ